MGETIFQLKHKACCRPAPAESLGGSVISEGQLTGVHRVKGAATERLPCGCWHPDSCPGDQITALLSQRTEQAGVRQGPWPVQGLIHPKALSQVGQVLGPFPPHSGAATTPVLPTSGDLEN